MATTFPNISLQFLVTLLSLNSMVSISLGGRDDPKSSAEFITTSCGKTRYPDLCRATLLSQANKIQTSPRLIVHTALNVALSNARSTLASMATLSKSGGLQPKVKNAMQDCLEVLNDSQESLRRSINELPNIKPSSVALSVSNIQTWVSASLTSQSTCSDVFGGERTSSNAETSVKTQLQAVAHLTSNALALLNSYASRLA
ncbi:hypothetical protein GQ457_03G015780 [Hibiscus cannabinus]